MPITRRSLLRSIAALPAAYYFGAAPPLWAAPHDCSSATSAYVILEGPWLIWADPNDTSSIKALTFGDPGHACPVWQQSCGGNPTSLGSLMGGLPAGITASGSEPPPSTPSSTSLFHNLFQASSDA